MSTSQPDSGPPRRGVTAADESTPVGAPKPVGPPRRGGLPEFLKSPEWALVAAILVATVAIYFLDPSRAFFSSRSLSNLLHDAALYGVLALGATVVIVSGGIDLSVGSVVALSAIVAAKLMKEWLPGASDVSGPLPTGTIAAAIAITLALGVGIGLLHAFLINYLMLPPFIATLATMAGLKSVAQLVEQRSTTIFAENFLTLGRDNVWTVTIFLAVTAVLAVLMNLSVLGRHLYALGGNEAAARLSGLPTRRLKAVSYGIAGALSALGGLLFLGNTGEAIYNMGNAFELKAITAAVVGGASLAGGVGTIRGTLLGIILIQLVIKGTGIAVKGISPSQIEGLVLGSVIILAVAFNQRFRVRRV